MSFSAHKTADNEQGKIFQNSTESILFRRDGRSGDEQKLKQCSRNSHNAKTEIAKKRQTTRKKWHL